MSLSSNVNEISYYSEYSIDKIARIYTGSYNSATDVISRNYTLAGSPYTVYLYRILHGMTRPLACELQWSIDGGVTYIDGGAYSAPAVSKIAFSDSTYVYIFDAQGIAGVGTVNYRLYCSWIDNYDNTNPLETVETYSDVPQQFDSRENYQKIQNQDVVSFTPGTFGAIETQVIANPLGYTPNVKVWFEAFAGEVWPLNAGGTSNLFLVDDAQDESSLSIGTNNFSITMRKFSNTTKRAWYKQYYDAN